MWESQERINEASESGSFALDDDRFFGPHTVKTTLYLLFLAPTLHT
jgi:hypothetical protein